TGDSSLQFENCQYTYHQNRSEVRQVTIDPMAARTRRNKLYQQRQRKAAQRALGTCTQGTFTRGRELPRQDDTQNATHSLSHHQDYLTSPPLALDLRMSKVGGGCTIPIKGKG
ncbi:Hypothetical predicted protein, partial [Pelobates cultripes]